MSSRNNKGRPPKYTDQWLKIVQDIRLAFEVLYQCPIRTEAIDFESKKVRVRSPVKGAYGGEYVYGHEEGSRRYLLPIGTTCYEATVENNEGLEQVFISNNTRPVIRRGHVMRLVGTSHADRWEEPQNPEDFQVTFKKGGGLHRGYVPISYFVNGQWVGDLINRYGEWITPTDEFGSDDHKALWKYAPRLAEKEFPGGNTRTLKK